MSGQAFLTVMVLLCIGLQLYHYALYPAVLALLAATRRKPANPQDIAARPPGMSLIICAFNEAGLIGRKIENSLQLDPPPDEIIVVADGSRDATEIVAQAFAQRDARVRVLFDPERRGKAHAMNRGAADARGDILVFSDANAFYERSALSALARHFSDPRVSVVSGSKRVRDGDDQPEGLLSASDGVYWRYESFIRRMESALGATVASVGEILAVRRSEWRAIPAGTVNDDAWITMTTLARGRDVRYAPDAISWERPSGSAMEERIRRRRINAGRIKLVMQKGVWPWRRPAVLVAFLSHKVLRLALPFLMIAGTVANLALVGLYAVHWVFVLTLLSQVLVFVLAGFGAYANRTNRRWKLAHLAFHIVQSNLTVLGAFADILRRQQLTNWQKPAR